MNVILDTEPDKKIFKRKIFFTIILLVCLIAILLSAYIQLFKFEKPEKNLHNAETITEEQYIVLEQEFENIFTNETKNLLEKDILITNKINKQDDIIGISYETQEKDIGKYNLDVKIPYININSAIVKKYNNQIEQIFKQKAIDILENQQSKDIVYTVNYIAYINKNNILSIAIRSILKEGANAQRTIIQTYNYDLKNNKEINLEQILEKKSLGKKNVEDKIFGKIKAEQAKVEELKKLGYNIFERNPESDMYKLENTTEFFLGEDNILYLIYAYGNENYTSELDLVIF